MKIRVAVLAEGGADDDAELAFTIEAEIPQRAGVGPAQIWLQFVNDLHRAKLGCARDTAARKARCESFEMRNGGPQSSFDRRDEVLHIGLAVAPDPTSDQARNTHP